mgnify:CR=1 FL=1
MALKDAVKEIVDELQEKMNKALSEFDEIFQAGPAARPQLPVPLERPAVGRVGQQVDDQLDGGEDHARLEQRLEIETRADVDEEDRHQEAVREPVQLLLQHATVAEDHRAAEIAAAERLQCLLEHGGVGQTGAAGQPQ